jgi:hypothetical protein
VNSLYTVAALDGQTRPHLQVITLVFLTGVEASGFNMRETHVFAE